MRLCLLIGLLWPVAAWGVVVGERAPHFPLPSMDAIDPPIALAQCRGRVVYINFWSAWRAPCRDAMPALAGLCQRYPGEALEIIAIDVDPVPDAGRRALAALDFRYPTASPHISPRAAMIAQDFARVRVLGAFSRGARGGTPRKTRAGSIAVPYGVASMCAHTGKRPARARQRSPHPAEPPKSGHT